MKPSRLLAIVPAKVNLGLEVVRRRDDGYHETVSILHAITLYDTFEWTATRQPFEYVGPPGIARADDLALRALSAAPDMGIWTGRLTVRKRIPQAAGLGGGSADAALALRLALPDARSDELARQAAALGADVPFFLRGGTALATGVGADLCPLRAPRLWFVLVTPALALPGKTRMLYHGLMSEDFSSGAQVRAVANALSQGVAPPGTLPNAFARQLDALPVVRYTGTMLARAGAPHVAISGAGPTLFATFPTYTNAARVAAALPSDAGRINVARSVETLDQRAIHRIARALRGRMEP